MFLLDWYRQYREIKQETVKPCESCETLKMVNESLRYENRQLIEAITRPPVPETTPVGTEGLKPIQNVVPWRTRRQMLEAEDREKAKLLRRHAEETKAATNVDKLETELGIEDASGTETQTG